LINFTRTVDGFFITQKETYMDEYDMIDYEQNCLSALKTTNFLIIRKELLRYFGSADPPAMLIFLVDQYNHFKINNSLTPDSFFYATIDDVEKVIGFSRSVQETSIRKLKEANLIQMEVRTRETRRYFKILFENVYPLLNSNIRECRNTAFVANTDTCKKDDEGHECRNTAFANVGMSRTITKSKDKNKSMSVAPQVAKPSVLHIKKKILINKKVPLVIKDDDEPDRKPIFAKKKKLSAPKVNNEIAQVLDCWSGLTMKIPAEDTASYSQILRDIAAVLDGSLFSHFKDIGIIRKYTVAEVKFAINNFYLSAFHRDYEPVSLVSKQYLADTHFCDFFYNRRIGDESKKSMFLRMMTPPTLVSNSKVFAVKDLSPHVSGILIKWYKQTFNMNGNFSIRDRNNLIICGREIEGFLEENRSKLQLTNEWKQMYGQYNDVAFLAIQLTRAMDKELRENDGLYSIFNSGWMKSDKTFQERLPKFLKSEHIMS